MTKLTNNVVILLSGEGSTLQSILDNCERANIVGVLSDNPLANGLNRARDANVPFVIDCPKKHNRDQCLIDEITNISNNVGGIQLIVLAGYMKILSSQFINYFNKLGIRIINIHPSLLPKYKGLHTHQRVLDNGDQYHGFTIHEVTSELDSGDIIFQYDFPILFDDTIETLEQTVKKFEQKFYPKIIDDLCKLNGHIFGYTWYDLAKEKNRFSVVNPGPDTTIKNLVSLTINSDEFKNNIIHYKLPITLNSHNRLVDKNNKIVVLDYGDIDLQLLSFIINKYNKNRIIS